MFLACHFKKWATENFLICLGILRQGPKYNTQYSIWYTILMTAKQGIVMYSTTWCADCRRAKQWLDAHNIFYTNINVEESEEAAAYVQEINGGNQSVPTIIFPDGSILVEPSNMELEEKMRTVQQA